MTYTADHPPVPPSDELRARIPGWGADLDPKDRPSVPKLRFEETGAHWDFPDRQLELQPRERSIEHQFLTPVFGTSTPPRGLSGVKTEFTDNGLSARAGTQRVDRNHAWMDPVLIAGVWVLTAIVGTRAVRRAARRVRR